MSDLESLITDAHAAGLLPPDLGDCGSMSATCWTVSVRWVAGPQVYVVARDRGDDTIHAELFDGGRVVASGVEAAQQYVAGRHARRVWAAGRAGEA